jgi:hypothetical protein
MHLTTLIAHGWIAASLVGAVLLPPNPPDGIYLATVDANGNATTTYYGNNITLADEPSPNSKSNPPASNSAKFLKRLDDNVSCNGFYVGSGDKDEAVNKLADWFGFGKDYKGNGVAIAVAGSVVAFSCDYGKGQRYTRDQFLADMRAVDETCGPTEAGWMTWKKYKSSYGRTGTSQKFC